MNKSTMACAISAALLGAIVFSGSGQAAPKNKVKPEPVQKPEAEFSWTTVVNNGDQIPGYPGRFYNSYNPPSVNSSALVAFRARSTGQQRGPVSGIFTRDMASPGGPIGTIANRDSEVPYPNNTCYPLGSPDEGEEEPPVDCDNPGTQWSLATFNEFPSFPRMALATDAVATRGNHPPVWTYAVESEAPVTLDEGEEEEETTRAGTTGAYVNLDARNPTSSLVTGASLLGAVPDFSDIFAVPGVDPATKFDVFPGAPAITDAGVIAFKGNYTDGTGKTGVFYRQVMAGEAGGTAAIELVANSDTPVPNPGACAPDTTFGSTAPPSAAGNRMVFVGFDNEDDPTCGGVYMAPLQPGSSLTTLVGLENKVPGQGKETFTQLGEGLSYDGRFVGFWGAWGEETKTVRLYCPQEGNRDRRDFCNNVGDFAPDLGDKNSICNDETDGTDLCYQEKEVPVNQGIFVYDTTGNGKLRLVARAGAGAAYDDFVYWNYSGKPPGVGEGEDDAEPPRWRSSAFQAVDQRAGGTFRSAFLARNGELDSDNVYINTVDGIYLAEVLGASAPSITTLVQTGMDGTILDPDAVWDDDEQPNTPDVPLPIASLALERDAFRGGWLAITASMGVEEAGWAGIYLTRMPAPSGK